MVKLGSTGLPGCPTTATGHAWTAPAVQEESDSERNVRQQFLETCVALRRHNAELGQVLRAFNALTELRPDPEAL
jgi:hypothetical protein